MILKYQHYCLAVVLFFVAASGYRQKNGFLSTIPHGLTVEYIRDPGKTKILDAQPEFSWIVPKEAVFQKAYQILVSSKREEAEMNIGDVWNSGQVRSGESGNIEFVGDALQPEKKYFWKVRIYDKDKRLSDYSEIQEFRTGKFGKNSIAEKINQVVYFNYFEDNTSSFSSSNEILNQLWDLCKYSIKATAFCSYYVEGDRERIDSFKPWAKKYSDSALKLL